MGVSDSDYDCMALSGAHLTESLIPGREKRGSVAKRER
ncbi:uncharacterized protein FFB20_12565 [Fusarium fujikuroi]|uniref:Uncharacterized protein n=1 Tax=Fusarium mangiferae TaxID=192010 RepID=A0A1L7U4R3_FUSMA|nr:uncharacterized protein FMAN_10561 [Fusarium mangiferae]SCO06342.1 uncharacterized protein FFB20_12565 [Fusarium fujikuroi]CVL05750.1 uncharacterized protein FMAN_10561 [Fusarium mangiferae]SCO11389.1 uncharacterized protein FFE2_12314 [Fusarium fujikuroi]SCO20026.1 uncharacterized protein FFM5_12206 [Fusarium fujikuroi]SCO23279.1 uncharacterized protein FFC1_14726 [Fusarium fujikuroi]